ncbi:MAG: ribose 5-phosphate isomerase B [Clostridiales bacterium]|jgi:ribose 5-phosphate isomerase B|nr:ribose 5-phosphate isomerase B [Clostridiales bacterium]
MIAIASDTAGLGLKADIIGLLGELGVEYKDLGVYGTDPPGADYPDYGQKAARAVLSGECDRGVIICGTGVGISIAANRFPGIRAALCGDVFTAKACRQHNDANILALGARVVGPGLAREITSAFLGTPFSGEERHARRVKKIEVNADDR